MAKTKPSERHWTEAEARGVLAAREASGLSMHAFALREGLRPQRLQWWKKRLADGGRNDERPLRFIPAIVKVESRPAITIRVGAKATMEIVEPSAVSAGWVAEVMSELERIACS